MNTKKGISLITLVITIIIIMILAAAIILSLSSNNPISKANEAVFKNTVQEYKGQLALWVASEYATTNGELDILTVNATKESGTYVKDSNNLKIKDIISIMKEPDQDIFEIKEGKLIFIGTDEKEKEWAIDVGASADSVTAMPVDISAGHYNSAILMSDGTVKIWGNNRYGQLGNGTTTDSSIPITVPGLTNVKQIAIGEGHAMALLNDGTVKAWGFNGMFQLGDGTFENSYVPVSVCNSGQNLSSILDMDVEGMWSDFFNGNMLKIHLTSDEIYTKSGFIIAKIKYIEDGITHEEKLETPVMNLDYNNNEDVTYEINKPNATSISVNFSLLAVEEEYDYVTILNSSDEILQEYTGDLYVDSLLLLPDNELLTNVKQIDAGCFYSLALLNDGTVKEWGYSGNSNIFPATIQNLTGVKQISVLYENSLALLNDGTVKEWGYDSNEGIVNLPTIVPNLADVKQISTGGSHSLVLLNDGTVKAWGYNEFGMLGNGTTTNSDVPVIVSDLTDVKQIEAGYLHSLALLNDGTVKAWGYNEDGELGNGNTYNINTPTTIMNGVKKISAGMWHSLALLNDGTVKSWGSNYSGQLGDGTNEDRYLPIIIAIEEEPDEEPSIADETNTTVFSSVLNDTSYLSVIKTDDDGYICVGNSSSTILGFDNNGATDAIIVKFNSAGDREWIKNFGGSHYDFYNSVTKVSDGYICAGSSRSVDANFTNNGGEDAILVKYDNFGNQVWAKNFGGNINDSFSSITEVSDGYICAGKTTSDNLGFETMSYGMRYNNAIVVKYNTAGDQQWFKYFGVTCYDDSFKSIIKVSDGFICAGKSYSEDAGFISKGSDDAIIVKYNDAGVQQWVRNFGGNSIEWFNSIIEVSDGYICVGMSLSTDAGFVSKGDNDAIVVKYNTNGDQQWVNNFGGYDGAAEFNSIIKVIDGFVCVGFNTSSESGYDPIGYQDAIVVKYNNEGTNQWIKHFGGSDNYSFSSIIQSDNSFVCVGNIVPYGSSNALILKFIKD